MLCSSCHTPVPLSARKCPTCGTATPAAAETEVVPRPADTDQTEVSNPPGWSKAFTTSDVLAYQSVVLHTGTVLGGRYEILESLGEGGMGSVFKARDREVDRVVALKVIRPELAGNQEILQRFRQELILASKITHRNVVRIYDLGLADGLRFISMEYIDGHDLKDVIREQGKLPAREAAGVMLQVCRGLAVAHTEGVIHRDLKPENVMVDKRGRVAVMDFGIAHSVESAALMTQAAQSLVPGLQHLTLVGSLLGTPRYMSPEQARSKGVDARSDIFSVGLIFYELITGDVPGTPGPPAEVLQERAKKQLKPPIEVDPHIPRAVSDIIARCVQLDPGQRYQSAEAIAEALETYLGIRKRRTIDWKILAGMAAAVVLLAATILFTAIRPKTPAQHEPVKILVSDFANQTGNRVLDGTLEPVMNTALEGASFITAYDRGGARETAKKLSGSTKLDDNAARGVARREGVGVVVDGKIAREGNKYILSARAVDSVSGKVIDREQASATNPERLSAAVAKVAAGFRKALGDVVPKSAQIAAAETFSSTSLEASQQYAQAQELQWAGKWDEAINAYKRSIALDPDFGRAYAGLAVTFANMSQRQEAETYYRLAMSKMDRMSDREKLRTRGGYYLLQRDYDKAIEQFNQLEKQYPADSAGIANLAYAYFLKRNMNAALEQGRRAVAIYPNNVLQLNNVGLFAMYAGDFDTAILESQRLLQMNPSFEKAYLCLGLSQVAKGDITQGKKTYEKLATLSPWGASEAAVGLADVAMYQGRAQDAIAILQSALAADVAARRAAPAAEKRVMLAQAYAMAGEKSQARAIAAAAAESSKDESVLYPAAGVYLETGDVEGALNLSRKLAQRFEADPQAYGKLIEAEVQMKRGDNRQAVQILEDARKIADTWIGRFDLGKAYLAARVFTDADMEFDTCINRRGEASSVFMTDDPTWRYFAPTYYYQGRSHQELMSPSAAEDYRKYLALRAGDATDPLARDARKRLDALNGNIAGTPTSR